MPTRAPLYVAAGAAIAATVFSVIRLPESLSKQQMEAAQAHVASKESIFKLYAKSITSKYAMLFMLVLVMTFGLANYESVLGLYVTTRVQFTAQHIAIILTTGAIIGVGMQALLVAKIIQAFGETKVIKGSLLLTSTAYIVLLFATHFWSIFLVTSIIFFATSMLRPALNTQLSRMAGKQGYVAGMNNAYMSVGNIVGPTLAGYLFDANIFAPFIAGCCILFITFLMIVRWN